MSQQKFDQSIGNLARYLFEKQVRKIISRATACFNWVNNHNSTHRAHIPIGNPYVEPDGMKLARNSN